MPPRWSGQATPISTSFPIAREAPSQAFSLIAADGELDRHRWKLVVLARRVDERCMAREQAGPQFRVLRARDLAGFLVSERVSTVADDPAFTQLDHVELLAQHRLDGVSPQRPD